MQNLSVGSWPRRRAMLSPNRVAIVFEDQQITYQDFDARVRAVSAALTEKGVVQGDRVAYWGGNNVALLEVLFAATRIGAIAVLVNARLSPREAHFILSDCSAGTVFFGSDQQEALADIAADIPAGDLIGVDELGRDSRWQQMHRVAAEAEEVPRGWDDAAVIMYTSGTTGRPKGAVLTHGNLFANDVNVLIETDVRPDEVCLAVAPLFHIAGLNGLVLPTFLKGGTIIIERTADPATICKSLVAHQVTSMFAVPAMLDAVVHHPGFADLDLTALRTLVVGGSPVPERLLRTWADRDVAVQQGYGLTETAPAVLKLSAEDGIRKSGAAGRPQFLVDVRLVGLDGDLVAAGTMGELQTVGPNVILEYWQRPDATETAFQDGWFCTGDAAIQDAEGFYWIQDRLKNMFISGGENVYPAEVESALLNIPGIEEAAVVGVKDDRWGEVGHAYVVVSNDADLSSETLREALLPRISKFKIPKHFTFIEDMPRTSTGKILKNDLRNATGDQS